MARILVTEKLAESGIELLKAAGHDVDVQVGLSPTEINEVIPGAHALIIRSATKVTEAMLDAGSDLVVVGRAGVGLDNVDVPAATARGVMVVNAPLSNVLSAAEQTMALILASARNTAQAHAALVQGRWERSKWTGMELGGKTLGIIGLGRIGSLVAQRARAFDMKLVGYDPFVSADRAGQFDVRLVTLDELAAESDIVTVHVARTPDTIGLVGSDFFSKAKHGVRVINVARGGIIDEVALDEALTSGRVGGAGLDVFSSEPMTESPLFGHPTVVVTPHLGASTREAQDRAGLTIAEQVDLALSGEFVQFAVNVDAGAVPETVKPFLPAAEQLGALFIGLVGFVPERVVLSLEGEIGGYDDRLIALSAAKGMLRSTGEAVSYVNARTRLSELDVQLNVVSTSQPRDYVSLLTLTGGTRSVSVTLLGLKNKPRVVKLDEHDVDVPPSDNMIVVRNDDRPGMIGAVGTILGEEHVNVDDMNVGHSDRDEGAVMVITTTDPLDESLGSRLRSIDGIFDVDLVSV
ncbi:MAG: phosphoglycerate dehydrogenase [Acidimicrobiia bacterium]|nr:phosphoglycerate dehydrogenase [Acidimicrobiia bacterium]